VPHRCFSDVEKQGGIKTRRHLLRHLHGGLGRGERLLGCGQGLNSVVCQRFPGFAKSLRAFVGEAACVPPGTPRKCPSSLPRTHGGQVTNSRFEVGDQLPLGTGRPRRPEILRCNKILVIASANLVRSLAGMASSQYGGLRWPPAVQTVHRFAERLFTPTDVCLRCPPVLAVGE